MREREKKNIEMSKLFCRENVELALIHVFECSGAGDK